MSKIDDIRRDYDRVHDKASPSCVFTAAEVGALLAEIDRLNRLVTERERWVKMREGDMEARDRLHATFVAMGNAEIERLKRRAEEACDAVDLLRAAAAALLGDHHCARCGRDDLRADYEPECVMRRVLEETRDIA